MSGKEETPTEENVGKSEEIEEKKDQDWKGGYSLSLIATPHLFCAKTNIFQKLYDV